MNLQLNDGTLVEVVAMDPVLAAAHSWRRLGPYIATTINTAGVDETPRLIDVTLPQLASAGSVENLIATRPDGWAGLQVSA